MAVAGTSEAFVPLYQTKERHTLLSSKFCTSA